MNNVCLIGRLTRDPVIKIGQTENGEVHIARFTLAVDRKIKKENEQQADFISCTAFGKTAEFCETYLFQGTKIAVQGRIQTGSYTNQDGNTVYTTDVITNNIEFAESAKNVEKNNDPMAFQSDSINDEELPWN